MSSIEDKFFANATRTVSRIKAEEVRTAVMSLEKHETLKTLANSIKDGDSYKSFSNDLINGYEWLNKNIDRNSIVLFGKHYELNNDSYIRSSISGRQMFSEGTKYKGVCLEKDFSFRLSISRYFFLNTL